MEIKAKLRFLRLPPRKVRSITDIIRGLPIEETEAQLILSHKRAAKPILKLLYSALANAKNSFSLKKEDLMIKKIEVGEGPTLDRWFPRAFGRAAPIKKRSSHILIVLEPKKGITAVKKTETGKPIKKEEVAGDLEKEKISEKEVVAKRKKEKSKDIKSATPSKDKRGFVKKIFSRKAI